jgi:hypothetical protein
MPEDTYSIFHLFIWTSVFIIIKHENGCQHHKTIFHSRKEVRCESPLESIWSLMTGKKTGEAGNEGKKTGSLSG